MRTTTYLLTIAAAALTLITGCTVKDVDAPALAGPSTFANNLVLRSSTDTLIQDGVSQAVITITATDANGNPKNIPLRADITVDGVVQDFGRLNTKTPTANGTPLVYTAPPASAMAAGQVAQTVTILVTPMDAGDFRSEIPRQIDIRLVPQGVILPINPNLVAAFTVTPNPPKVLDVVLFDASTSTNSGAACSSNCSYAWDFGDGTGASGQSTTHQYRTVGIYQAKLTITDARGAQAVKITALNVGVGTPPTVDFIFTPSNPSINQTIFFNASSLTRPATGRTIVSYEWDFGKGSTGTGATVSKSYSEVGTYQVTLKVTDDAGAVGFKTTPVVVGTSANPTASLEVSPASPRRGETAFFDASGSRPGGAPIAEYRYTWGDGTPDTLTQSATVQHTYSTSLASGSYTVRVTVTDTEGRQGTVTKAITLQ